ncbi:MAG: DUF5666 domain-containing protein [Chloroflexota bacterium]
MTNEFQPVDPTVRAAPRVSSTVRTGLIVASSLAAIIVATAVFAAPSPSSPPVDALRLGAGASASPSVRAPELRDKVRDQLKVRGIGREIRITAISGNRVSLETVDGWTRTVVVDADTVVRKGGVAAAVTDLAVGDRVALRQRRNDDGTFSVTSLVVPQPVLGGEVSAVTATRITISQRDGSSATIHVGADTRFKARRGLEVGIGDVKVGDRLVAVGNLRSDGSMDAAAIQVGGKGQFKERGPKPDKSPKPSAGATQGGEGG